MLKPTFRDALSAAGSPLVGLWTASGSAVAAEIMAGSGADLLLVDGEHSPVTLPEMLTLLQAVEPYPVTTLVRVPWLDEVFIKQVLDLGAQNILIPKVSTAEDAALAVRAARYPGREGERDGIRGIGSALARSSRWGRVGGYVGDADRTVSVTVQIETARGVENARAIAEVDGVDAVFIGPADLAGSMGFAGVPSTAAVVEAVDETIAAVRDAGCRVGVNAFAEADADRVLDRGADFVFIGADVTLMARGSERAVQRLRPSTGTTDSY